MKKMNRQERRLTWKYFWKQKLEEITDFFDDDNVIIPFIVFSFMVGGFFQIGWSINPETGLPSCMAIAIIGICIWAFWIILGLIALIKRIVKWLRSNWKKAKARAQEELKIKRKKNVI